MPTKLGLLICLFTVVGCGPAPARIEAPTPGSAPASRPAATADDCRRWAGKVEAAIRQSDGQVVDFVRQLVRTHQVLRHGGPRQGAARCRALVKRTLRDRAVRWHRDGAKAADLHALELASTFYDHYLRALPGADDAYDVTFYHAELLFKLRRWTRAAQAYGRVLKMKPAGKHAGTASYARIMACKGELDQVAARPVRRQRCRGRRCRRAPHARQKIPPAHQRFLAAVSDHLRRVPAAPQRVPLLYRQARVYYAFNHYDEAVKLFAVIVTKHPDHELAVYAGNLLLDSLNSQRKLADLASWVNAMLKEPRLARGDFLLTLTRLRQGLERKAAEALQQAGKFDACGRKYLDIANAWPKDARAPEVLYNGALCFEAAKRYQSAIKLRQRLIAAYPKSRLAARAMYQLAGQQDVLKRSGKAAAAYERFAARFPGEREAFDALRRALALRLERGEQKKALALLGAMQRRYGANRRHARDLARALCLIHLNTWAWHFRIHSRQFFKTRCFRSFCSCSRRRSQASRHAAAPFRVVGHANCQSHIGDCGRFSSMLCRKL